MFQIFFTLQDSDAKALETFLHDIVGFFIIEAIVLNSTQDFRSRSAVSFII
jgi:exocyst complex component 6